MNVSIHKMLAKKYLNLLILCLVLCQGIIGTLSEEDIDESSKLLFREKRVINLVNREQKVLIKDVPYIVFIKIHRSSDYCPGSILTKDIVITIARCVREEIAGYRVYAGTARLVISGRYSIHKILEKRVHTGEHPYRMMDGIALASVDPPFIFTLNTQSIKFYEGHIEAGTLVTVRGWGCSAGVYNETEHPDYLRSITVPIIDHQTCANIYNRKFAIGESDICTHDPFEVQFCGQQDGGAPLVLKQEYEERLVGLHLWNGGIIGQRNPDVYVNLQYPVYKTWMRENMIDMERRIYNYEHRHLPQNIHNLQNPHFAYLRNAA